MKFNHFPLLVLLMAIGTPTFAQPAAHVHELSAPAIATEAQNAFQKLKTLAGSWAGRLTTAPQVAAVEGRFAQFSLQVASRGNALLHEMSVSGLPDHPVTMFYLDAGQLTLTHYCDAGNRPRMAGKVSPDGKTVVFELLDVSGGDEHGHMHRAVFTFIDENHHTEEWTFMAPGEVPMRARFDLQRTNFEAPPAP